MGLEMRKQRYGVFKWQWYCLVDIEGWFTSCSCFNKYGYFVFGKGSCDTSIGICNNQKGIISKSSVFDQHTRFPFSLATLFLGNKWRVGIFCYMLQPSWFDDTDSQGFECFDCVFFLEQFFFERHALTVMICSKVLGYRIQL